VISQPKNILLTGPPRCGKTTVIQKVIEALGDWRLCGFYTEEMRSSDGRRLGFEAIGLGGTSTVLAHVGCRTHRRVGRYGVRVREFEALVEEELARPAGQVDLIVIDEIGKMESYSTLFVNATRRALDGPLPVLATVAQRGAGFISEAKQRSDVELLVVSDQNRDTLPAALVKRLQREAH
jgi:nucleoside-triphosphatase THEP1